MLLRPGIPSRVSGVDDVAAISGARVALSAVSVPCRTVIVQAHPSHTGGFRVGGSDVSATRGLVCRGSTNDEVTIDVSDLSELYVWGLAADAVACVVVAA